jgi:glycosyltransferase involved in cell wall biosynthesis
MASLVWRFFGSQSRSPRRVFLVGAFYNPGWLLAHAVPLVRAHGVEEVVVICDDRLDLEVEGLRFNCPSDRLKRRFGRGAARVITLFKAGLCLKPEVIIGYHIMPNAPLVLLAAAILNAKAVYQMTGGPGQVLGGGYGSESPILSAMGGTSKFVEMAICHLVRRFDVVIVRGQQARKFVEERNISRNCVVLTGAIELADYQVTSYNDRKTDLIYVCRLVKEVKGLEPFLNMLRELVRERNSLSVMIVGDGPDREYFEGLARAYDLESCVAFVGQCNSVPKLLMQAKVFCLLSPSEGMSIAMLEAMAAGVPVVVTDVGELGDAVKGHGSGILIRHESAAETAKLVGTLLDDLQLWGNCSSAARKVIEDSFSVESITAIWNRVFTGMGHRHALPYRACRRDRAS